MLTPYKHQQKIIDLNPRKYLIAHGCGLGKTQTSLFLALKNKETALIVVPKALKLNWARAIEEFNPNHLIVSKEEFRRDWDKLKRYNTVILDEFHYFGNLKSLMSKALQKYIRKYNPAYVYGLTATPFSNPMNIYALGSHLGRNWPYWNFYNKFFHQIQMGRRTVPVQKKGMEKELISLIKEIGDTCTMEECVDLPEQTFETVYFDLTPGQKKAIKNLQEPVPITRWTKTHGIIQGMKIGDEYTQDEYFDCLKNDYIVSLSEENPKMVVVCRYNLQIALLKQILEKNGKKVFVINGAVKNRDEVVQEVESIPECIVLLQADCGVGFELPSIPLMVFASLSFSFVAHEQSIGRILRINRLKKNVYLYLVAKDTVDEDVYKCIMQKKDFYIDLYKK